MLSIPLQYALVIAIAITQIFGGVSCCCVGRAVVSSLVGKAKISPPQLERDGLLEADESRTVVCPKCRARVTKSDEISSGLSTDQQDKLPRVGQDDQCRCTKIAIKANVPKAPVLIELDSQPVSKHVVVAVPVRNMIPARYFIYEVPIRLGGHSWQSIACIWKI